jgi:hypothetical protein
MAPQNRIAVRKKLVGLTQFLTLVSLPIYNTLYCGCIVGGIKLGAGGLIRAYGAAARQVLREAPVDVLIPKATFRVTVGPQQVGAVYDAVGKVGGSTSGEEYGADGSLTVTVTCDLEFHDKLRIGLVDGTRGEAIFAEKPFSQSTRTATTEIDV